MTDTLRIDHIMRVSDRTDTPPPPLRVRIGISDEEHRVLRLTARGFALRLPTPVRAGARIHVSFRLRAGLSISLETTARQADEASKTQWFDFVEVDRDLLNLLLSQNSSTVH